MHSKKGPTSKTHHLDITPGDQGKKGIDFVTFFTERDERAKNATPPVAAPAAVAPAAVAPVTVAPVTVAPVTVAPVTVAPVTVAPVTAPIAPAAVDDGAGSKHKTATIAAKINQKNETPPVAAKQDHPQPTELKKEKRTRPRLDPKLRLNVDIELQQEQQVETSISLEQAHDDAKVELAKPVDGDLESLHVNDFSGVFNLVRNGELNLTDDNHLLSKTAMKQIWNRLFGHISGPDHDFFNRQWSTLSDKACEQLLRHSRQLNLGLDPQHLPTGFSLFKQPGSNNVKLEYDAKAPPTQDPFAVELVDAPCADILNPSLFDDSVKALSNDSPREKMILAELKKEKENARIFHQHLPALLHFSEHELEILFKLVRENDDKPLSERKLDFVIQHLPRIANRHLDSEDEVLLAHRLASLFAPNSKDVVALATQHMTKQTPYHPHLLLRLLGGGALRNSMETWIEKLGLSNRNLDALLDVYNRQGVAGIGKLFTLWNSIPLDILRSLQQTLFQEAKTYMPMLDDAFPSAISILKGFAQDAAKYEWWVTLLLKHAKTVGYSDLPKLIKAFITFSTAIEEKQLHFYALTANAFRDADNMPVALGRMLMLLEECNPRDIQTQWQELPRLSLQSNGAVRALTDAKLNDVPCTIVTAAMQIHHTSYDAKVGYRHLEVSNDTKDIHRCIAFHEDRLPYTFYQRAFDLIEKSHLNPHHQKKLVYLVLNSTNSGSTRLFDDEATSLTQLRDIISELENVKLPLNLHNLSSVRDKAQADILDALRRLTCAPPLPIMLKTVCFATRNLNSSVRELNESICTIEHALTNLVLLTASNNNHGYEYAIYEGMRFYDSKAYEQDEKEPLFIRHLNAAGAIDSMYGLSHDVRERLIRLISTFQLTPDQKTLEALSGQIQRTPNKTEHALELLTQVKTNLDSAQVKLTPDNLVDLLEKVNDATPPNDHVPDVLETHLRDCFAKDFFDKLRIRGVGPDMREKINKLFESKPVRQQVITLLEKFNGPTDGRHYESIVQNIYTITRRMNARDRAHFLAQIEIPELHTPPNIVAFNALLNAIIESGRVNEATYLLSEAKSASDPVPKTTLWIKTLFPALTTTTRKSTPLSAQEIRDLSLPLLLKSTPASLSQEYKVSIRNPLALVQAFASAAVNMFDFFMGNKSANAPAAKIEPFIESKKNYTELFKATLNKVGEIVLKHPSTKPVALHFFKTYIKEHKEDDKLNTDIFYAVNTLQETFASVKESSIPSSLFYHYSRDTGRKPSELVTFLNTRAFQDLSVANKTLFLSIITSLLNNNKPFQQSEVDLLLSRCHGEHKEPLLKYLGEVYRTPPYPSLKQINQWHEASEKSPTYLQALQKQHANYSKEPVAREADNGFHLHLDAAKAQAKRVSGIEYTDDELASLAKETARVRELDTQVLVNELTALRTREEKKAEGETTNYPALVALTAELLYRSKGMETNSFEINYTQYLALLSMLKSGGRITSEIATGEGKTRIMMIAAACQFALNKTVDFVTSNMQLVMRDYLEYQAYFKLVGARTCVIYADTPPREYQQGAIHFTSASQLSLFRNQARSVSEDHKVIDSNPHRRALLLDEADQTYFDVADTRFNYSAQTDRSIMDMEWIYPLLIDFFAQDDDNHNHAIASLYHDDIDACEDAFFNFVASKVTPEQLTKLRAVSAEQISAWQEAAITARALVFEKDFVIASDTTVITSQGPKIASEARLLSESRVASGSTFSFGVHQCLHARLNKLRTDANLVASPLKQKLTECRTAFHIKSEKQIIYSSNSKDLLDDYARGNVLAVTGTAGSIREQEEAKQLYGQKDTPMTFASIPRHQGLRRKDLFTRLAADENQQVAQLLNYIEEAKQRQQPTLIVCENDTESKMLHDLLAKSLPSRHLQRIHSQNSLKEEADAIEQAGRAGMVTVSTAMVGRGTDIKPQAEAKTNGLKMLVTYLPRERDMQQILGRSGRFGGAGDTRLVLNKKRLKKQLNKTTLTDGFYANPELYLRRQQALFDRKKQGERLIKFMVGDFNRKITTYFFNEVVGKIPRARSELTALWAQFTKDKDQIWNQIWPDIMQEMGCTPPSVEKINRYLSCYQEKTQTLWNTLCNHVGTRKSDMERDIRVIAFRDKPATDHSLQLSGTLRKLITEFDVQKDVKHCVKVHDAYDPAHAGMSVVYSRPFETFRAFFRGDRKIFANTRAWYAGEGILFANLRAYLNSHITFKQLIWHSEQKKPSSEVKLEAKPGRVLRK
jgi:preprotein translocase subunit SecA